MRGFKKVLVPVDLSEQSPRVLERALSLCNGAVDVTLLHVVDTERRVFEALGRELSRKHLEEALLAHARQAIDDFGADLDIGEATCRVHPRVELGQPAWKILEVARDEAVDLIVIGAHNHGLVHRFLLGSVADKVIRGAEVPVLLEPLSNRED